MECRTGNIGRIFIVRVDHGEGVLAELTRLAGSEQIKQAVLVLIGAVGELMNIDHGLLEWVGVGSAKLSGLVYAARDAGAAASAINVSQSRVGFYGITVLVDYAIMWRIRQERIALIVEVIEMDCNIKRLVCGVCAVVMLGFFVGGSSAAASHTEEVKFKGVVTGYPDFGDALGIGGANVQIGKILSYPTCNLTIESNVTVSWPIALMFAYINVTAGDRVEVCDEYRDIEEMPVQWSGVGEQWVLLNTSDHYIERSDIRFIGTAIEYFKDPGTGARYGWNVSVDKLISGPQPCSNRLNVTLQAVAPPRGAWIRISLKGLR